MEKSDVKDFIFNFFEKKGTIPGDTEEEKLQCDFLYSGLLDSMGLVDLIGSIESELGIELDSDDMENPDFKLIGGLIEILQNKIGS